MVSGASGAEASADGESDPRETYPEGAGAGALEPPPPPDMGGGRSPESSAQLLDMCDVCVEQSPRSGRCVRGNAGVAAGRGDATHPIGTKKERPRDLSPVKSVKPLEADRRTAGNEFETRIGFGFNAFDVPVGKPGKKPTQRDWRLKLSDRARADGALGSTRREGQAWTPLRSTLDGSVRRVNGPPGRARRPGGVRGEPGDSCARKTQNTRLDAVAMGPKKRKAESTGLDEMDRELYQRFRAAANSVSSMYTSSLNLQKRAFNGGARHTTEKLLQWALSQQASGEKTISASDLIQALQAELVVLEGEDASLAAAGDSPGGVAPWTPSDRAAGAMGRTRAHLAALDANAVRPTSRARLVSRSWVFREIARRLCHPRVSVFFLEGPEAHPKLAYASRVRREQEYEQGLGAKLGQAFTQHAQSPGAHTRSSGQAGAHQPSPGTRAMDDD